MVEYRIAKDDRVRECMGGIFSTRHAVNSQRQLKRLVEKDLKADEVFRVGESRLRQIAIDSGKVDLEIHCRETIEMRSLVRCPVCAERLARVRNMTVFGGTVTLGYRCSRCGYWTGLRKRGPPPRVVTGRGGGAA